jgi:hypothetical protein
MNSPKELRTTAKEFYPTLRETTCPWVASNARRAGASVVSLFNRIAENVNKVKPVTTLNGAAVLLKMSIDDRLHTPETWGVDNAQKIPELKDGSFANESPLTTDPFPPCSVRDEFGSTSPAYPGHEDTSSAVRQPVHEFPTTNFRQYGERK